MLRTERAAYDGLRAAMQAGRGGGGVCRSDGGRDGNLRVLVDRRGFFEEM